MRFTELLAMILTFCSGSLLAAESRTVQVTGTSVTRVAPDEVTWTIEVSNRDEDLATARQANDKAVSQVLACREILDLENLDIQTSRLRIEKVYTRDTRGNQGKFRYFTIQRTVTIRQRDLAKFDAVLHKLTTIEEVEARYHLSSTEYHEIRRRTRLAAVTAARDKAKEMTTLLDANLGQVIKIDAIEKGSWAANPLGNNVVTDATGAGAPDVDEGTFAPGAIRIQVSVEITFEIT